MLRNADLLLPDIESHKDVNFVWLCCPRTGVASSHQALQTWWFVANRGLISIFYVFDPCGRLGHALD
jgi:hypothetical protein